jgi:hypothetical protein
LRLAWDPGITWFVNSVTDKEGRADSYFQEFSHMVLWVGSLEEPFSEGWIRFLQCMVALPISSIQVASCVSALLDNDLRRGCFTSFRLVWDPGIILSFGLVQLVDHRVVMALFEDNQSLGREDCNVPIFGFPCSAIGDDFMGLRQLDQRGDLMLLASSGGLEKFYDAFRGLLIIFHHQDHTCAVRFRFLCISTVPVIWEY